MTWITLNASVEIWVRSPEVVGDVFQVVYNTRKYRPDDLPPEGVAALRQALDVFTSHGPALVEARERYEKAEAKLDAIQAVLKPRTRRPKGES